MGTKIVSVQGKDYTVRQYSFGQRQDIMKKSGDSQDNNEFVAWTVFYGIANAFKSIDDVKNLDANLVDELFIETLSFNMPDETFLTKSQNLSSLVQRVSISPIPKKQ